MSEAIELHRPCPHCGSSDAAALYPGADGGDTAWWTCFSCDKKWPDTVKEDGRPVSETSSSTPTKAKPPEAAFVDLPDRGLSSHTLKKCGYYVDQATGDHWETYTDANGARCAWKVRYVDKKTGKKNFRWEGDLDKKCPLFMQSLWSNKKGKMVIVTEGEIDAMSIAQAQGFRWPVVSIPNGASAAPRDLAHAIEWLAGFEKIVLMFDNDKAGKDATEKAAKVLPPGKVYVAKLPTDIKDANDALQKRRIEECITAAFGAQPWLPGGIVSADELIDRLEEEIEIGIPWRLDFLTQNLYGRQYGDTLVFTGATSSGKSDILYDEIAHVVYELGEPAAVFSWESDGVTTLRQIVGKGIGKRLHIPDPDHILYTQDDLAHAKEFHREKGAGRLFLNEAFGVADPEEILNRMRHLAHAHGVKHFVIDPLTAIAATFDDERQGIDKAMAALATLGQELQAVIYIVSHLKRSDDGSHEEGARVRVSELRGSGAIGFWAHKIVGIERDQQVPGSPTTVRVLKNRIDGSKVGQTARYSYDLFTGRLEPYEPAPYEDIEGEDLAEFQKK